MLDKFDKSKTEVENMFDNGYFRIFDCGNLVYKRFAEKRQPSSEVAMNQHIF